MDGARAPTHMRDSSRSSPAESPWRPRRSSVPLAKVPARLPGGCEAAGDQQTRLGLRQQVVESVSDGFVAGDRRAAGDLLDDRRKLGGGQRAGRLRLGDSDAGDRGAPALRRCRARPCRQARREAAWAAGPGTLSRWRPRARRPPAGCASRPRSRAARSRTSSKRPGNVSARARRARRRYRAARPSAASAIATAVAMLAAW